MPGRQGGGRARDRAVRPARARHPAPARRLRRRHRRGGGADARQPARLRRPELRLLRRAAGLPAAHAGPDRGRDDRRRRPPRLRAHAADARAAHPAREGDAQHLHRAGAQRARGRDLPELARPRRGWSSWASCCCSAPPTRARRWRRSRASSCCTPSRSCASSPSTLDADVDAVIERCAADGRQPRLPARARLPGVRERPARRDHRAALQGRHRPARRARSRPPSARPCRRDRTHLTETAQQRDRARTIFEKSQPGRRAFVAPELDVPAARRPAARPLPPHASRRGCPRSPSPRSCATTTGSRSATSTSTPASTRSARAR